MAKLGNEVWDAQWLQDRIRALESELTELRKRPPKELWDQLCEQVAQMCEHLGSNRADVPCDSWHLRDLILRLESKLKAAEEREEDVRTLDEWARADGPWREHTMQFDPEHNICHLKFLRTGGHTKGCVFDGATPDESRAKAAAWVRSQSPEPERSDEEK